MITILNGPLRSLRHKNFRLFFMGQSVSLLGTWMQQVAISWLVYRLGGSAFILGCVAFAVHAPALLSPLAGLWADAYPRKNIVLSTQTLSLLQALCLAALVWTGYAQIWHVMLLSLFLGIVNAIDVPARQSFLFELIDDKKDLPNAIALHGSMFNSARLIGPVIAGFIIAAKDEFLCFSINAASYLAVILALSQIRVAPIERASKKGTLQDNLKSGFGYVWKMYPIRLLLIVLMMQSFSGLPYSFLMPVFAKEIFHGGPKVLGLLVGATGAGAVIGALYVASSRSVQGFSRRIRECLFLCALSLAMFSVTRIFWVGMMFMFLCGFSMMVIVSSANALTQTLSDDDKRGRVMSYYTFFFLGTVPLGALWSGWLANTFGPASALQWGAIVCLGSFYVFRKNKKRFESAVAERLLEKGLS